MATQTEGTLGDQTAKLIYDKHDTDGPRLKWQHNESTWSHIPLREIIAVTPVAGSDEHSILQAVPNETEDGDEKKKSSLYTFQTTTASNLPSNFIQDFQPTNPTDWVSLPTSAFPSPNLHVLISTGSGTGLATQVYTSLLHPLLTHLSLQEEKDYTVQHTTSSTSVTEFAREILLPRARAGIAQRVILLSGDGGVVDIINALTPLTTGEPNLRRPSIALLPLGTGNALAHSSGVADDGTLGLAALMRGESKPLPLFRARFSPGARALVNEGRDEQSLTDDDTPVVYGAVVFSWGHHASLVADSDTAEYRKHGAERFKMAAKEALFPEGGGEPHKYLGKVSILPPNSSSRDDWQVLPESEHAYVLATLVKYLEKGFAISPSSTPVDGSLRLVYFASVSGEEAMGIMGKAYQEGKHVEDERVRYLHVAGLKVEFEEVEDKWRRVCVDGMIVRVERGGWVEVRREGEGSIVDLVVADSVC